MSEVSAAEKSSAEGGTAGGSGKIAGSKAKLSSAMSALSMGWRSSRGGLWSSRRTVQREGHKSGYPVKNEAGYPTIISTGTALAVLTINIDACLGPAESCFDSQSLRSCCDACVPNSEPPRAL